MSGGFYQTFRPSASQPQGFRTNPSYAILYGNQTMPIDFQGNYARMLDEELLVLVQESDDLTPEAYDALWAELRKRGLDSEAGRIFQEHQEQLEAIQSAEDELVTIARFEHSMEANLAKTRLESAGIHCFLADEHAAPLTQLYPGGVKLQVRREDAESARMLLEAEEEV